MNKGFVVLEIIFAGALMLAVTVVIIIAFTSARSSFAIAGERLRGQYIAHEGIQALRNLRDTEFDSLAAGTWGLSREGSAWELVEEGDITDDLFRRTIVIDDPEEGVRAITVLVEWDTLAGPYEVRLQTHLTDWRRL